MKRRLMLSLIFVSLKGAQAVPCEYFVAHKYNKILDQKIDGYVCLVAHVEKCKLCRPTFNHVRRLYFTHPCIIRCYNELVKKQSVLPLYQLWRAYKADTISLEKNKFIYELCHLIGIVFEQLMIKLLSNVTGESAHSLNELFDKISEELPIDELVEVLEICYEKIATIVQDSEDVPQAKIQKRWIVLVVSCLVVVQKTFQYFYNNYKKKAEITPQQS